MPKYDYSEYKMSESEKIAASRRGNQYIKLDYYDNEVRFDSDDRLFTVYVDSSHEFWSMKESLDEDLNEERKHREVHDDVLSQEDIDEREQNRIEGIAKNEEVLSRFQSKFSMFFTQYKNFEEYFYNENPEIKVEPLHNVLSGVGILLKYGEGILDFVYADFQTPFQRAYSWRSALDALGAELREGNSNSDNSARELPKIYNSNQLIVDEYLKFAGTAMIIEDIMYASLYSAVCPPVFLENATEVKALRFYYSYLRNLQKEYLDMMEFCFDEDFYPEVLNGLTPSDRYYLYKSTHGRSSTAERSELVTLRASGFEGIVAPEGVQPSEYMKRISSKIEMTEKHKAFAERYGVELKTLEALLKIPRVMQLQYEFHTVEDILEMEFTTIIKDNVRFRKCKRCGKYFIMKGNYDTQYCDRVAEGQTRTCQDLAAQEKYKARTADSPELLIYSKYYKRYAARVRVRQIKEADFKKWKYQALAKRDECTAGKITPDEFTEWLEGCFPNRTPKNK